MCQVLFSPLKFGKDKMIYGIPLRTKLYHVQKTIRSLFELIQVLTQIVNHPYLVSYRVITK